MIRALMISASLCFSIKWGQEIPFQRKTEGYKLNGFGIWELTTGNVTGRCNSDCNPAAKLEAFTKKLLWGYPCQKDQGTVKTLGQPQSCSRSAAKEWMIWHHFPASLGSRQYWLQLRWSCTIVLSNAPNFSKLVQSMSAVSQQICRRKGEIISSWKHDTS